MKSSEVLVAKAMFIPLDKYWQWKKYLERKGQLHISNKERQKENHANKKPNC